MITPKGVGDFQVGGMTPNFRSATADYSAKHNWDYHYNSLHAGGVMANFHSTITNICD